MRSTYLFLLLICTHSNIGAFSAYPPDQDRLPEASIQAGDFGKQLFQLPVVQQNKVNKPAFKFLDDEYTLTKKTKKTLDFYAESSRQVTENEWVQSAHAIHYEPYWFNTDPKSVHAPAFFDERNKYATRWLRAFINERDTLKKIGQELSSDTRVILDRIVFIIGERYGRESTTDTAFFRPNSRCLIENYNVELTREVTSVRVDRQRIGQCTKFDVNVTIKKPEFLVGQVQVLAAINNAAREVVQRYEADVAQPVRQIQKKTEPYPAQPNLPVAQQVAPVLQQNSNHTLKYFAAGIATGGLIFYAWKYFGRKS